MPLKSAIFTGQVWHSRTWPKTHKFKYKLFMMYLDLDELDKVFRRRWFWSVERLNIAVFRRKDFHGDPNNSLKAEVLKTLKHKTGLELDGPVRILTHLRYFGICINPVSFYYCFDKDGETLRAIVAEIENTPWQERYTYCMTAPKNQTSDNSINFEIVKAFHVSPFFDMNLTYRWQLNIPDKNIDINMENYKDDQSIFSAGMYLKKQTINSKNLNLALLRYPFMTLKVILGIYWQALRIWLKGIPFYSNPNPEKQWRL